MERRLRTAAVDARTAPSSMVQCEYREPAGTEHENMFFLPDRRHFVWLRVRRINADRHLILYHYDALKPEPLSEHPLGTVDVCWGSRCHMWEDRYDLTQFYIII